MELASQPSATARQSQCRRGRLARLASTTADAALVAAARAASNEARARGLWPVLDAVISHEAALALYESCGWSGREVTVRWADYPEVEEFVYLGPGPARRARLFTVARRRRTDVSAPPAPPAVFLRAQAQFPMTSRE